MRVRKGPSWPLIVHEGTITGGGMSGKAVTAKNAHERSTWPDGSVFCFGRCPFLDFFCRAFAVWGDTVAIVLFFRSTIS